MLGPLGERVINDVRAATTAENEALPRLTAISRRHGLDADVETQSYPNLARAMRLRRKSDVSTAGSYLVRQMKSQMSAQTDSERLELEPLAAEHAKAASQLELPALLVDNHPVELSDVAEELSDALHHESVWQVPQSMASGIGQALALYDHILKGEIGDYVVRQEFKEQRTVLDFYRTSDAAEIESAGAV